MTEPMRAWRMGSYYATQLHYPELRRVYEAGGPELPPYRGLATLWDAHSANRLPDYADYLAFLAREKSSPLDAVLDLACGTGWLTARLTTVAAEAVGVDRSPEMLAVANERYGRYEGVSFHAGDFRDFTLGRRFDAAVCASNSLNYVEGRSDLARVFVAVARHLKPGGVFLFDTVTEAGMRHLSGQFYHAQVGERRFALRLNFDAKQLRERSQAILPEGVETHCRVPIGLADVRAAAAGTGMTVTDTFSNVLAAWHPWPSVIAFFVLTRDDTP